MHQSPAFGEDDFASCRRNGVAMVNPIDETGHFDDDVGLVGGAVLPHANADLVDDLTERGLLFRHVPYEHTYPHCWRCHTPLLYYALPAWYIRTTAIKDELLAREREDQLVPRDHQARPLRRLAEQQHRLGAVPQPLLGHAAADLAQRRGPRAAGLRRVAGRALRATSAATVRHSTRTGRTSTTSPSPLDGEQGTYRRVPEVIDAWFDSGSMPFAQWGYPHVEGSAETLRAGLPGAVHLRGHRPDPRLVLLADGGRHAGVRPELVRDRRRASGHILAEDGRKMSKHLGNILEPIPLMDEHGADALRWFMACSGSPWAARRVGHTALQEIVRKVLLTYWNTVAFHVLYANAERLDARRRRRRPSPTGRRSTVGPRRGAPAGRATSPRRWRTSTPSAPARCSRRTSTTCRTGTSAARAAGSGPATPSALATLHEMPLRRHAG